MSSTPRYYTLTPSIDYPVDGRLEGIMRPADWQNSNRVYYADKQGNWLSVPRATTCRQPPTKAFGAILQEMGYKGRGDWKELPTKTARNAIPCPREVIDPWRAAGLTPRKPKGTRYVC